jgi:hypothetical protein
MLNHKTVAACAAGALVAVVVLGAATWPALANQWNGDLPRDDGRAAFGDSALVSVVPAAAFSQDGDSASEYWFGFLSGRLYGNTAGGCLKAPVYLPYPAVVNSVYATVVDTDAGNDVNMSLYRVDNYTGLVEEMANMSTSGAAPTIQTLSVDPITVGTIVNYPGYSYYATVCLDSWNNGLYSVRVWYDWYRTYMPTMLRS